MPTHICYCKQGVMRGKIFCKFHKFSLYRKAFVLVYFCLLANQQYIVESLNLSTSMQNRKELLLFMVAGYLCKVSIFQNSYNSFCYQITFL